MLFCSPASFVSLCELLLLEYSSHIHLYISVCKYVQIYVYYCLQVYVEPHPLISCKSKSTLNLMIYYSVNLAILVAKAKLVAI